MKKIIEDIHFIGIGFPRCGTSWLAKNLANHRDVCIPGEKELHFFNHDSIYSKGVDGWYLKKFLKCKSSAKKYGEFTPGYAVNKNSATRIKECFPNIKILCCVRDPFERAQSEYYYNLQRGMEYETDFFTAVEKGPYSDRYFNRGDYYEKLAPFIEKFNRENIMIIFFEDIKKKPEDVLMNVCKFLGIGIDYFSDNINEPVNASREQTLIFPLFNKTIMWIRQRNDNSIIKFFRFLLKPLKVRNIILILLKYNDFGMKKHEKQKKIKVSRKKENKIRAKYIKGIKRLEDFTSRDLSHWMCK